MYIRMLTQNNNDDLIHKQQEITAWGLQMQESEFKKIFNANTKTARQWLRLRYLKWRTNHVNYVNMKEYLMEQREELKVDMGFIEKFEILETMKK